MAINIPTFKTKEGRTIYKKSQVEALINAVYADQTKCQAKGEQINILTSERTDTSWDVVVEFDYE